MVNQNYTPQILGFYLDIVSISDSIENALSVKEYPFSTRNIIENMGPKTRRINVSCQFNNNLNFKDSGWSLDAAIPPYYDNLNAFMSSFKAYNDNLTFTHPDYGEINGYIGNITVARDDTVEQANVTFQFIEEVPVVVSYAINIRNATAADFTDTNDKTNDKMDKDLKETAYPVSLAARARANIAILDAWLDNVTGQATSIVNTLTYEETVPGLYLEAINNAVDRIVSSYVNVINIPAQYINNIILGLRTLKANFTGIDGQFVHIMGASRLAFEVGEVYESDTIKNNKITKKSETKTFDSNGNFVGSDDFEVAMTINELEDTLYNVRAFIDEAIQFDRDNRPLQNAANNLQKYVNEVKLDRQSVETKENVPFQSMHTWVTTNNLSYQAAETILKLNPAIKNPTFIDGELKILV